MTKTTTMKNDVIPALILVHGLASNDKVWKTLLDALSGEFPVVTLGNSLKEKLQSLPDLEKPTIKDFACCLHKAIEQFGLKNNIVMGAGMGSAVGLQFALDYPESVVGLVLINARPYCDDDFNIWIQKWMTIVKKEGIDGLTEFVIPRFFPKAFIQSHPEVIESYRELRRDQTVETVVQHCRALMTFDVRERLNEIKVPVLLITGGYDVINPPSRSKDIAEKLPDAKYIKMEECGSMPYLEKPHEFHQVINDFVRYAGSLRSKSYQGTGTRGCRSKTAQVRH